MGIFLVDDTAQTTPSRSGIGSLLDAGGIHVPEESVQDLEKQLETVCAEFGFPSNEIFKWSPGRELWMYKNLVGKKRQEFFARILDLARDKQATAAVITEDASYKTASGVHSSYYYHSGSFFN